VYGGYGNPLARLLRHPLEAERSPQSDRGPDGVTRLLVRTDARRAPGRQAGDRRSHDPEEATGDSKRKLDENVEKHNRQAREAVQQDRDDLARKALEKKKSKMTQIEELEGQIAKLNDTQEQLVEKKNKLQNRIEEFRTKKESMKARYQAAEASSRVSEAMTGVGDEMEDVSRSIERAEERTEDMEARAEAMDELEDSGAFEDALSDKDSIDRELDSLSTNSEVDAELETLKGELGKGEPRATTPGKAPTRRSTPNWRTSSRRSTVTISRPTSMGTTTPTRRSTWS